MAFSDAWLVSRSRMFVIANRLAYATSRVGEGMQSGFRPGDVARNNKPAMVLAGLHGGVITRHSWRGEAELSPGVRGKVKQDASIVLDWALEEVGDRLSQIEYRLQPDAVLEGLEFAARSARFCSSVRQELGHALACRPGP